jgi:hypothetical protein
LAKQSSAFDAKGLHTDMIHLMRLCGRLYVL